MLLFAINKDNLKLLLKELYILVKNIEVQMLVKEEEIVQISKSRKLNNHC